jgi:hypothetical protein
MRMRPNKHGFDVFIIIDNLKPKTYLLGGKNNNTSFREKQKTHIY